MINKNIRLDWLSVMNKSRFCKSKQTLVLALSGYDVTIVIAKGLRETREELTEMRDFLIKMKIEHKFQEHKRIFKFKSGGILRYAQAEDSNSYHGVSCHYISFDEVD